MVKYSTPFVPAQRLPAHKFLLSAFAFLLILAILNLAAASMLFFAGYDESFKHTVILRGEITSSNMLQPLENVKISVEGENLTVYSDADGNFNLSLTTGAYNLTFDKPGYNKIHGTVVVGKYLDNHLTIQMEEGNGTTSKTLTEFATVDEYIANLMVSCTLSIFVGCFALLGAYYIRKGKYRSWGIASAALGLFSVIILSGLTTLFLVIGIICALISIIAFFLIFRCSEIFIQQCITTTDAD